MLQIKERIKVSKPCYKCGAETTPHLFVREDWWYLRVWFTCPNRCSSEAEIAFKRAVHALRDAAGQKVESEDGGRILGATHWELVAPLPHLIFSRDGVEFKPRWGEDVDLVWAWIREIKKEG